MLPVERWTVFYADGSTFTSEQGTWAECPPFGVQAVVYYRTDGRAMQEVGNDLGVVEYLGHAEGCEGIVKMPLWTDGESYWRVHDLASRCFTPEMEAARR